MQQSETSVLTLENRQKLSLSGVTSVDAFSEHEIILKVGGKKLKVGGTHLKVLSFSEGTGNFAASGEIVSLRFGDHAGLKSLLK